MARHLIQQPRSLFSIPVFLAPAFSTSISTATSARAASSSSNASNHIKRGNRDKNKKRGVSVIRGTGPRQPLSVQKLGPLPKPVADPTEARAAFEVNENHGLWGFFNEAKEAVIPPGEEGSFGRPWSKLELSRKGWDDLHKLYWACVKEMNILRTRNNERKRLRLGYGLSEADDRMKTVRKTMFRICQTLIDRHYGHFDAKLLLEEKNLYDLYLDVARENIPAEYYQANVVSSEDNYLEKGDNLASSNTTSEIPSPLNQSEVNNRDSRP